MDSLNFSASETKLLLSVLSHNKGGVQPDWDKVAEQCGYNAPGTARAAWNRVYRTKLNKDGASSVKEEGNGEGGGVDKSPGKKSPAKPRKVKSEEEGGSPKKKARKSKKDMKDEKEGVVAFKVEEVEISGGSDGAAGE